MLLLAAYNYCQYYIDLRLADAMGGLLGGDLGRTRVIGLGMALFAALSFGARVVSRLTIFNAGRFAEYELRTALLHHLHRLGPAFYRRMSTGDIMSRVTNDLQQVRGLLGFGVLNLFNTGFGLVSALAVMLQFSHKLTLAALAPLPLLLLVMRLYSKSLYARQRENQDSLGELGGRVQSSISGVRVVRAFSLEEAELASFDKSNEVYLDKGLILAKLRGSMWPVMQAITMLGVLVVFWYGGRLILAGEFKAEQFLSFYRALFRLTWPLAALGFLVSVLQRGLAGYERLKEIFDAQPDVVDGSRTPERIEGQLDVDHLTFGYLPDQPVLRDLTLSVAPGERVAIVGRTGAGKSTLGALLARLYATPRGSVFLDGIDVCDLPLSRLRAAVLYNQQTPFLFSTTVGRNVGYVLEHPETEEAEARIQYAAREAQIRDEIAALPEGFDTVVGERGVQLSGGQKQRVALARALLARPRVLILDDPLSAVDAKTEVALIDALQRHCESSTLILITHRVSAAARCDRILVMDAGRIVEQGHHDVLARAGGLYSGFVEEQRRERELSKLKDLELDEDPASSPVEVM
ncbi:MAG TPA: ABC transporter ATP-binding protein [Polyangiaceae bacterium]|nr:ABC transporter ATP-binding protein [Polyangiaceae bacterium]